MADARRTSPPGTISSGFLPITGDSPRVLILGSFPGMQSLRHTEYYGNPQNHFWKIMESLFAIDYRIPYRNRIEYLTGHHIALWDVIHSCTRRGSADGEIREPVFNDISGFLATHPTMQLIVLNGTTAGRYYRRMNMPRVIKTCILPSTSPANTRYSLAEKVEAWKQIRVFSEPEQ